VPESRGLAGRIAHLVFVRGHHVCPWWFCHVFDNPLRRLFQNPGAILAPLVRPGDRVLDVGAGMGYFTIPLARAVGELGKVTAVDLQRQMLDRIVTRAARAGVRDRIDTVISDGSSLGVAGPFDFALAHWMLHEVPDQVSFLARIAAVLAPGGHLLVVEPKLHVSREAFEASVARAAEAGFSVDARPKVPLGNAVLLRSGPPHP
jgi:2-polyprenyl-3-methyl-5-hydroxy-6-metoxy-1,4-benzoquinol methylase